MSVPTSRPTRSLLALIVGTAALLTAVAGPAHAAPGDRVPAPVSDRAAAPLVRWQPCDPGEFFTVAADGSSLVPPSYQCATYRVPLDYDRPRGPQIDLALIRRPADGPRRGSILVNPGGPGGSGVDTVAYAADGLFGPDVLAAFDVVGFDPRGIARSTGLRCYADNDAVEDDAAANEFTAFWPRTDEEYAAAARDSRDLARDCRRTAGPIIAHMGTTNVARDMDVLRRAVGDAQLNFVGFSYGTYVCAQYLTQYPTRAGAVVCDANIDPVEYATGEPRFQGLLVPNLARALTEVGTNATHAEFLRLCDEAGPDACAFAPDARARFERLRTGLAATPVDLGLGFPIDDRALIGLANGALYSSVPGFPFLAGIYAELEARLAGAPVPPPTEEPDPEILPPANEAYAGSEGFFGVSCSDNVQPNTFSAWRRAIERSRPPFGPFWASGDLPCATWPASDTDTVLGPFDRRTPHPVLVINTRFDPATPYEDAVDHARRLPNSALLTVEGWGHVGYDLSACSAEIVDRYLLTRTVPSRSMTCTQDTVPFAPAPEARSGPAVPEPLVETAVDTALAELATTADALAATDAATDIVIAGLERAGRTDLAEALRVREAILREARIG